MEYLDIFKDKKNKSIKMTRETYLPIYCAYTESLNVVLEVKDELVKEIKKEIDKKYNTAFLVLLSKIIQHMESIVILVERGLYGDAFVVLRGVLSDMNMMHYLHYKPELIELFLKESDIDYQSNRDFKKNFSETAVDKCLKEKGMKSIKDTFQKLSKGAHASAWGAQYYGTQELGNDDQYNLKYGPGVELKKAVSILGPVVSVHYDLLNVILWHKNQSKIDISSSFWKNVIAKVRELKISVISLSDSSEFILSRWDQIHAQAKE